MNSLLEEEVAAILATFDEWGELTGRIAGWRTGAPMWAGSGRRLPRSAGC